MRGAKVAMKMKLTMIAAPRTPALLLLNLSHAIVQRLLGLRPCPAVSLDNPSRDNLSLDDLTMLKVHFSLILGSKIV